MQKRGPCVAGHFFCEAHERLGSDSEVVMLEQVSEGTRGPCVSIFFFSKRPVLSHVQAEHRKHRQSLLGLEAGAVALASRAQAMSRNVGLP